MAITTNFVSSYPSDMPTPSAYANSTEPFRTVRSLIRGRLAAIWRVPADPTKTFRTKSYPIPLSYNPFKHNVAMAPDDWDAPRTEEGLQQVLLKLEECRATGDLIETGNGLLVLSFLVKWVRSDTVQPPFVRSHELVMQALDLFRRAGHVNGQVRAMVAASAMADPAARESMLAEAESLAESLGEENLVAMVLAARARALALSDRATATDLHRRVLDIYRRTGNQLGQAHCLFSLSIGGGDLIAKRDYAIEAAVLFRASSDPGMASRCVSIALMHAEEIQPLTDLEGLIREGLEDAQKAMNRIQEGHFYDKLALIALMNGNVEDAENYRRWSKDLQDAEGLTPRERWDNDVQMTKTMISMTKTQGNKAAMKMFQDELKRLKASKPGA